MQESPIEMQTPELWKADGLQRDSLSTCVIAQQYSSRQEKFRHEFKTFFYLNFSTFYKVSASEIA